MTDSVGVICLRIIGREVAAKHGVLAAVLTMARYANFEGLSDQELKQAAAELRDEYDL